MFVGDYVLPQYGSGAVMGVPAHDARDFDFAREHGLPIVTVVRPPGGADEPLPAAYEGDGAMTASASFDGQVASDARPRVVEWLAGRGLAARVVRYRLRDWLVSRQRYWGAPIPIIHCERCGAVPVPARDLPVLLPEGVDFVPTGESPRASSPRRCATWATSITASHSGGCSIRGSSSARTARR